ncbi:Chromosome segregation in meiosis protein 3 [Escovopsis weberi]|uniref:Chromosome segregation in meiosis protein n=1 Tax=Escovopsis weberi TaxID=150374 RepID=A0A0M8N4H7_ESCWE|nr:Chromosome segregation in meiosis protein 3 [Escovopsis weberi]
MAQRHDDLDNYTVDFDDDGDPFASPPPETSRKRKEPDDAGLGIDKEVAVQKRARVPNVKLDDERLTRRQFSDAARLLSFYQLWLDDLFPKARFLDALSMVEKAGHKKKLQAARQEWISQGKPHDDDDDDDNNNNSDHHNNNNNDDDDDDGGLVQAVERPAREMTPARDMRRDVPNDEDLYDATPRASRTMTIPPATATARHGHEHGHDAPDEDDLEALMAEAELLDAPRNRSSAEKPNVADTAAAAADDDDEDLDALIAEAEALDRDRSGGQQVPGGSLGGQDEYADDEDAMREMEGW